MPHGRIALVRCSILDRFGPLLDLALRVRHQEQRRGNHEHTDVGEDQI
jgi:hypothetical protein